MNNSNSKCEEPVTTTPVSSSPRGRSPSPAPTPPSSHISRKSLTPNDATPFFKYNSINESLSICVFELYACVKTIASLGKYLDEE